MESANTIPTSGPWNEFGKLPIAQDCSRFRLLISARFISTPSPKGGTQLLLFPHRLFPLSSITPFHSHTCSQSHSNGGNSTIGRETRASVSLDDLRFPTSTGKWKTFFRWFRLPPRGAEGGKGEGRIRDTNTRIYVLDSRIVERAKRPSIQVVSPRYNSDEKKGGWVIAIQWGLTVVVSVIRHDCRRNGGH